MDKEIPETEEADVPLEDSNPRFHMISGEGYRPIGEKDGYDSSKEGL